MIRFVKDGSQTGPRDVRWEAMFHVAALSPLLPVSGLLSALD